MPAAPLRRAFTAIELMVVLTVAIMLGTLAIGALLPALRRGKVSQAVDVIGELSNDARRYSRANHTDLSIRYGIRIDGSSSPNRVLLLRGGEVIATKPLSPTVQCFSGDAPLTGIKEWWYQRETGFPIDAASGQPKGVGVGPVGSDDRLSVRTLDQQVRMAVAIYEIGVLSASEF